MSFHIDSITDVNPTIIGSTTNDIFIRKYHPDYFALKEGTWYSKVYAVAKEFNNKPPTDVSNNLVLEKKLLYLERDSVLIEDYKKSGNDIIAIWLIMKFMHRKGYNPLYKDIFSNVNERFKKTSIGRYLRLKLDDASRIDIDSTFPILSLIDIQRRKLKTTFAGKSNKYALIDFWYSHCGPCIAQFPGLKKIYSKYKDKRFEIFGVSIDTKDNEISWRKAIKKYELNWPQYLDIAGIEASKLSINSYPSNFLISSDGKIVAKNITPAFLESFLQLHISN